ncbi:hypothetical protein SODALDRAFT_10471 [Sodiomyces alkalinus F11]|uniref:Uncharacterized protein n=1 Tax=Sodiomyces alkalinus (strain CBS 110278 / VKM F-3762 / F11) TaxID=1314773 RepID=A0A3N2Q6G7_SODAK|nr:hypothetical protein SODALDRAFT_10471 [Sodiomyces alkalinus F11]ROT42215.1 hypothetical protein SODALDRAFT_10471 [Sodiomyces alkalinus F11]
MAARQHTKRRWSAQYSGSSYRSKKVHQSPRRIPRPIQLLRNGLGSPDSLQRHKHKTSPSFQRYKTNGGPMLRLGSSEFGSSELGVGSDTKTRRGEAAEAVSNHFLCSLTGTGLQDGQIPEARCLTNGLMTKVERCDDESVVSRWTNQTKIGGKPCIMTMDTNIRNRISRVTTYITASHDP